MKSIIGMTVLFSASVLAGCVGDEGADSSDETRAALVAPSILADPTAFRFVDLDLRDPHVFVSFLGCRDVTDTPFFGFSVNGQIATSIGTDSDADGLLDFSPLVVFRPLDPATETGAADVLTGACTAADPSTCSAGDATVASVAVTNTATGACLAALEGTTGNYTPAITSPTDACFSTSTATLQLMLAQIPITLSNAQVAAEYSGDPATGLVDGLLRGFISEADADATVLPATLPLVGGRSLSSLLPGGTGNCSTRNDKDTVDGVTGWWFYLNFTAQQWAWTDPPPADPTEPTEP
jgi:hypothetical protein